MTDAILYTTIGSGIGAGALGFGATVTRMIAARRKRTRDRIIAEYEAAKGWDARTRTIEEEKAVGRLALATVELLKPHTNDLRKRAIDADQKLAALVQVVQGLQKSLSGQGKQLDQIQQLQKQAQIIPQIIPDPMAAADLFPKARALGADVPAPRVIEPQPWSWRTDAEARGLAEDLVASLVLMKMPKDQAVSQVANCMNRCAKQGCARDKASHDKLFAECFKK